jgi:ribonuclease-3 family protein
MSEEFYRYIADESNIKEKDVSQFSPLVMAYIGDAVYEVFIRTMLISDGNLPVHLLHKRSINFVKAKAQSDIIPLVEYPPV